MQKSIEYKDIEEIVEKIIKINKRFWNIPSISYDDVSQEIRLFCAEVIKKFNYKKGSNIEGYLSTCISRFIRNYLRDKYFNYKYFPCTNYKKSYYGKKCEFFIDGECRQRDSKCKLFDKYVERKRTKENFNNCKININTNDENTMIDMDNGATMKELVAFPANGIIYDYEFITNKINGLLTERQRAIYEKWLDGDTVHDISRSLGYSPKADARMVRYHIVNIVKIINVVLKDYRNCKES